MWLKPSCFAEPLLPHKVLGVRKKRRATRCGPVGGVPHLKFSFFTRSTQTCKSKGHTVAKVEGTARQQRDVQQSPSSASRHGSENVGHTSARRTGARSIKKWQVPEIATAPFLAGCRPLCSARTGQGSFCRCWIRQANLTLMSTQFVKRSTMTWRK